MTYIVTLYCQFCGKLLYKQDVADAKKVDISTQCTNCAITIEVTLERNAESTIVISEIKNVVQNTLTEILPVYNSLLDMFVLNIPIQDDTKENYKRRYFGDISLRLPDPNKPVVYINPKDLP
jgi:hypothetical protein